MTQLTKEYFDTRMNAVDENFIAAGKTLTQLTKQMTEHETKLDAILTAGAVRQEVRNLVQELKLRGVELDETKIFVGGA